VSRFARTALLNAAAEEPEGEAKVAEGSA
jgi:hypothetical protein